MLDAGAPIADLCLPLCDRLIVARDTHTEPLTEIGHHNMRILLCFDSELPDPTTVGLYLAAGAPRR